MNTVDALSTPREPDTTSRPDYQHTLADLVIQAAEKFGGGKQEAYKVFYTGRFGSGDGDYHGHVRLVKVRDKLGGNKAEVKQSLELGSSLFEINKKVIRMALQDAEISYFEKRRKLRELLTVDGIQTTVMGLRTALSDILCEANPSERVRVQIDSNTKIATLPDGTSGVGLTSYAQKVGVDPRTLRGWVKNAKAQPIKGFEGLNRNRSFPLYDLEEIDFILSMHNVTPHAPLTQIPEDGLIQNSRGLIVAPIPFLIAQGFTYTTAGKILKQLLAKYKPVDFLRGMRGGNPVDLFLFEKIREDLPIKLDKQKRGIFQLKQVGGVVTELYKRGFTLHNKAVFEKVFQWLEKAGVTSCGLKGTYGNRTVDLYYLDDVLPHLPYKVGKDAHVIGKKEYVCLEKYLKVHGVSSYTRRGEITGTIREAGIRPCRDFVALNHGQKDDVYELKAIAEYLPANCRPKLEEAA